MTRICINRTRNGQFAICKQVQVNENTSVIVPISERRFLTHHEAECFLNAKDPGIEQKPEPEPKPIIEIRYDYSRDKLRVVKLEKGVFVVEVMDKRGRWQELRSFKTRNKANEFVYTHSR